MIYTLVSPSLLHPNRISLLRLLLQYSSPKCIYFGKKNLVQSDSIRVLQVILSQAAQHRCVPNCLVSSSEQKLTNLHPNLTLNQPHFQAFSKVFSKSNIQGQINQLYNRNNYSAHIIFVCLPTCMQQPAAQEKCANFCKKVVPDSMIL